MEGLRVVDHPVMARAVTELRAASTSRAAFRAAMADASSMLAYEALRDVPTREVEVQTPLEPTTGAASGAGHGRRGPARGPRHGRRLPALRARRLGRPPGHAAQRGDAPTRGLLRVAAQGRRAARPSSSSTRCSPPAAAPRRRLPACARPARKTSGWSASSPRPRASRRSTRAHPDVPILTAVLDRGLDERGFIRPGLGDAGDRLFGTD